jgi:sulfite reductase subunit B
MQEDVYTPIEAEIEDIIEETYNIKTFVVRPSKPIVFKTGQFVEVTVPGAGEAPFTPSSSPQETEKMELTIMSAGSVTGILHNMQKSDKIGIRGPYGKGYPLDEFKGRDVLIVGGGVGLAPLRSLIFSLFNNLGEYKKVSLRYGARTPRDIVYKDSLAKWKDKIEVVLTVDKGEARWKGNVGLVTTILDDLRKINITEAVAVVCGPPIMMKFVTFKLLDKGFAPKDIYLSMEKNMSCGLGMCGHCRIGPYHACKDGPVFKFEQLKDLHDIWD